MPVHQPRVDDNDNPSLIHDRLHCRLANTSASLSPRGASGRRRSASLEPAVATNPRSIEEAAAATVPHGLGLRMPGNPERSAKGSMSARDAKATPAPGPGKRRTGQRLQVRRTSMADIPAASEFGHFADWCRAEHGHLVSVWWKLDDDNNMSISKTEFLKGLLRLGFKGDMKKLWTILDRDNTGILSFHHFAPESALDLALFKRWAELRHGSLTAAFQAYDADRSGTLTLEEFQQACEREEIPENLKGSEVVLFQLLGGWDRRGGLGTLSRDKLAALERWTFPAYLWQEPDFDALKQFRSVLCGKHFGNPLAAWRKALDRNSDMKLGYSEFRVDCAHEVPALRDVNGLYCALDRYRSGWISLRDWDKVSHLVLSGFAAWAKAQFGRPSRCVRAWEEQRGEGVGAEAFTRGVKPLELSPEQVDLLFGGLSLEAVVRHRKSQAIKRAGTITPPKIAFLDQWEPDYEAMERDAWEALAAQRIGEIREPAEEREQG